jgi:lipoprotein-anchoring transpeptidase ErfK/SrfK
MSNRSHIYRSLTICLGSSILFHPIQSHAAPQPIGDQETDRQLTVHPINSPDLQPLRQNVSPEPLSSEFSSQPVQTQPQAVAHTTNDQEPSTQRTLTQGTSTQETSTQIAARLLHVLPDFYQPLPGLPQPERLLPEVSSQQVRLVISLKRRRVDVYQNRLLKASYPVAIGKPGWETPKGQFRVFEMRKNPGWTHPFTQEVIPPGPDNPLGERWIAFWTDGNNSIGFHGTPNRASVGKAASHGCVRMYNEHVRELYQLVKPGTSVAVVP